MARSKIPDLLFDDILLERAARISRLCCRYDIRETEFALDRITLFVTHRCNLFCRYCNGPHMNKAIDPALRREMLKADITLGLYKKLLKDWSEYRVKYIHFTGGEATLNKNLPEFIRLARESSILCSLTTNGTAGIKLYRKLIDSGLTEIRISIDSMDEAEYDRLVRKKGAHKKVIQNIKDIIAMRDREKKDIFIVLNICVGTFNVSNIKSNLKYFFDLDPDDIKLLVIGEQSKKIYPRASRKIVDELLCYSHDLKPGYKLLDNKIHTLFRRHARGLKDPASRYEMQHCFIPLTERTLDARGYYPCSIYLRYYGDRILDINSTFQEQKNEIIDFIDNHDCLHDPICKNFCTNCCKKYSLIVNREISNYILRREACTSRIVKVESITPNEISKVISNFNKISRKKGMDFHPFIRILGSC
ncbi:GTP 3',8-cyclase [subsurface metagenome]